MKTASKKIFFIISVPVLIAIAAVLFSTAGKDEGFILFFSGAGMKIPVTEIIRDFEASTGTRVNVHFEGSSILRRYIETYRDVDLFLSGDRENMDILLQNEFVDESAIVAWHVPAILVPAENRKRITGLNDLAGAGMRIVMSNPHQASLGKMVYGMLQRHPKGRDILKNVVVYGSSSQDDLRIFRELYKKGAADAVIEWDVMTHVPEGNGLIAVQFGKEYEIRDLLTLALLRTSKNPKESRRFYDYFRTEGIRTFRKYGYATRVEQ